MTQFRLTTLMMKYIKSVEDVCSRILCCTLPKGKLMEVTDVIDAIMCSVSLNSFTFIIIGAFIKYVLTQQNQFIDVFCLP